MLLVKGAAFALDPESWPRKWLEEHGIPKERAYTEVRAVLQYLLKVLTDCRTADIQEIVKPGDVNPIAYQAVMMGVSALLLRRFNTLFRQARLTDRQTGAITEPVETVDTAKALYAFDQFLKAADWDIAPELSYGGGS